MSDNDKVLPFEIVIMVNKTRVTIKKLQARLDVLNALRNNYFRLTPDCKIKDNLDKASAEAQKVIQAMRQVMEHFLIELPSRRQVDAFKQFVSQGERMISSLGMGHFTAFRSGQIMQKINDWRGRKK
jgi:hypothetical protein